MLLFKNNHCQYAPLEVSQFALTVVEAFYKQIGREFHRFLDGLFGVTHLPALMIQESVLEVL